ncbi:Methyltransferase type 12 [Acidithiobacillus ferrivorans SS3]|uniref:Methyltransferase type 12 n=1 Tax=Acidithiobacillus ferrivorans SS3 TaxID=743299 RepID=G0JLV3_9PROT|nr:class I SAM-dependent methyltransferase [Acidithiobacillus ferrivorans]AEM49265.1 Methyltransferase type 12 [Acidithiobacillus ferrivorans SS3]
MTDDEKWAHWDACYAQVGAVEPEPLPFLAAHADWLPAGGRALDLACGRGGNALFLARRGLETEAWDYAESAVAGLRERAVGLPLQVQCRDVIAQPPAPESFAVIVVAHFLHRPLFPALAAALRPGGLLFYATWAGAYAGRGPQNMAYRLDLGELAGAFPGLILLELQEDVDRAAGVWRC